MKSGKKICAVILAAAFVMGIGIESYADEITIELDEKKVACPVPARIENGRTMVPMRAIFEAFGMQVSWNNEEKKVTATNGEEVISLTIGDKTLYVNGEAVQMDVAPFIADDTTLVPVRAVSEGLEAEVNWNNEKRRVEITTAEFEENKDAWKENTGAVNVTDMTFTGKGVSVEGNVIKITEGGDFSVTGENDNVMIHVDTKYKVKLRLEGVKMSNPSNPVIFFENSNKSFITISKGYENYITDGEEYTLDAKAAIFSNDDIEIKGEGTLCVTSKAHHALAGDDDIKIEEGTLVLSSDKKDGIHANNTIKIQGGDIKITAYGDGIEAEEDVIIEGGAIDITTTGEVNDSFGGRGGMEWGNRGERGNRESFEGLQPNGNMTPPEGFQPGGNMTPPGGFQPGGNMTPPEGFQPGGNMTPPEETTEDESTATKGIKGETDIAIKGGSITVNSADHAVHSGGTLNITGGEMILSSQKGKGISAHGDVVIDNGRIDILKASEGLESKANLTINGGIINIKGSDDGINAGGTGGRDAVNRSNPDAETGHDLIITGGEIFVDAQGDGLDANGRMIIEGGNIIVEGPTNNGNGALDSGGSIKVNGGTLIALGASGMAESPDNDSKQPSFKLVTSANITAGSDIVIKNQKGEEIYRYKTLKTGNSIVFSSPELKVGETYTVTIGEETHTIEMKTTVTNTGNGGFGGFGGGRRPW